MKQIFYWLTKLWFRFFDSKPASFKGFDNIQTRKTKRGRVNHHVPTGGFSGNAHQRRIQRRAAARKMAVQP